MICSNIMVHCNVWCSICHDKELVNSYELLCDTIFWTNLHLSEEYPGTCIRWLCVDVNAVTAIVPPSTLRTSCAVTTTLVIIIIWSRELHPIQWVRCKIVCSTYSSKPSNSQWILFTATSYTKLIGNRSCYIIDIPFSSPIDLFVLSNSFLAIHTKILC